MGDEKRWIKGGKNKALNHAIHNSCQRDMKINVPEQKSKLANSVERAHGNRAMSSPKSPFDGQWRWYVAWQSFWVGKGNVMGFSDCGNILRD